MQPIYVKDKAYYLASDVAELWNVKESTIKRYAAPSSGKIRGAVRRNGQLLIPANTIRPITKAIAQGLLWGLVEIKNNPTQILDFTEFSIEKSQLKSVLEELARQQYIELSRSCGNLQDALERAYITEKGFELIKYKQRYSDNPFQGLLNTERLSVLLKVIQTVVQLAGNLPN